MDVLIIKKFKDYFSQIHLAEPFLLDEIYQESIIFQDPVHKISGIEALKSYFEKLNSNLLEGGFNFTETSIIDNKAYLTWEMTIKLKRPRKTIKASGISVLIIEDNKISEHRDYFDAGELFYEHIPLLGWVIRKLKKQLGKT